MILRDHYEAIEYDLLTIGIDLADLWQGRMSWRRLGVILRNLPADSAYSTSVREATTDEQWEEIESEVREHHGRWSRSDFLLARTGDLIQHLIWMQTDRKTPPPEPLPRPGVKSNVVPLNRAAVDYLNRTRELRGAMPDG